MPNNGRAGQGRPDRQEKEEAFRGAGFRGTMACMDNSGTNGSTGTGTGAGPGTARQDDVGRRLEETILALLAARADTSTICPSDAARAVAPDSWRPLMDGARQAAARLVERGAVEITQHGEVVDLAEVKGPIRIRARR